MPMNQESQTPVRITDDSELAEEWELVLLAQGLSPSLRRSPDGVVVGVPQCEADRALASLSAYERENQHRPTQRYEPLESGSWLPGMSVGIMLLIFFAVTVRWLPERSWFARGSADAERILLGEFWRVVTALTLHADIAHVVSNAIAVALLLGAVSSTMGAGLGGALVLLAGAGGNLANAALQGAAHLSIGASTAVFGAVGLLGSLGVTRRRRQALSRWRAWLPLAAALALLGMLGSGAPRVDIWAHLLGLLVGAVLGFIAARITPRPPEWRAQWAWGGAAVALVIYSWTVALG